MKSETLVVLNDGVEVRWVGDEALVVDAAGGQTHTLDRFAARVVSNVDGATPVAGIASRCGGDPERVAGVLAELEALGLVASEGSPADVSRRRMLRNVAVAGAAGTAAAVVGSVALPGVAAAQTQPGGGGGNGGNGGSVAGQSKLVFDTLVTGTDLNYRVTTQFFLTAPGGLTGTFTVSRFNSPNTTPFDMANIVNASGVAFVNWFDADGDPAGQSLANLAFSVSGNDVTITSSSFTGVVAGSVNFSGTLPPLPGSSTQPTTVVERPITPFTIPV